VGRQLVAVEMGMGIMPGSERRFCLRVVGRVRLRVGFRVVPGLIIVALLVLAGMCPDMGLRVSEVLFRFVSW